eukprot:31443-Pelagococcus_subviridis.AAC.4
MTHLKLRERLGDQILHVLRALHPHHVDHRAVRHVKRAVQRVRPTVQHILRDRGVHPLVHHEHDEPAVVEAAAPRASAHLRGRSIQKKFTHRSVERRRDQVLKPSDG